ncbi:hypothetical protein EDD85DRAFT_71645 [Armillaria nabsnona]|nr:hypothetical protein EDD85DRAFT_71645 [Armillaria nabsnona]
MAQRVDNGHNHVRDINICARRSGTSTTRVAIISHKFLRILRMAIPCAVAQNEWTSITPWNAPTSSTLNSDNRAHMAFGSGRWLGIRPVRNVFNNGANTSVTRLWHSTPSMYISHSFARDILSGNARRYWHNIKRGELQQQIHHYGSGLNALPSIFEFATSRQATSSSTRLRQSLWSDVPLQSKRLQPSDGYRNVPHRASKFRMAGVWRDRDVVFFHVCAGTCKSETLAVHCTHCRDVETGRWGLHYNPSTHTVVVASGAAAPNRRLVASQTVLE